MYNAYFHNSVKSQIEHNHVHIVSPKFDLSNYINI